MTKRFREAVEALGAEYLGELPDFGGGAFAAAQLAKLMSKRLSPEANGAPEERSRQRMHAQSVSITARASKNLSILAQRISRLSGQRVSKRQVAGLILEKALGMKPFSRE